MIFENDILLEELVRSERMSAKAQKFCLENGLISLNKMLRFYSENGDFKLIKNCDDRTSVKLKAICNKYIDENNNNHIRKLIDSFGPSKRAALNINIEHIMSAIGVRLWNALLLHVDKDHNYRGLLDLLYSNANSFRLIPNIGSQSISKLLQLRNRISDLVIEINDSSVRDAYNKYTKSIFMRHFHNYTEEFDMQLTPAFDSDYKVKIFKLFDILINANVIYKEVEKKVFSSLFTIMGATKSYDFDISKARVKQIADILRVSLWLRFDFIDDLPKRDLPKYELDPDSEFIIINDEFAASINNREGVDFNAFFYAHIFSIRYKGRQPILGDTDLYIINDRFNRAKKFRQFYLVSDGIISAFYFNVFIESVQTLLKKRKAEDMVIDFRSFVGSFYHDPYKFYIDDCALICENILRNEFDLIVDSQGFLVFKCNIRKVKC